MGEKSRQSLNHADLRQKSIAALIVARPSESGLLARVNKTVGGNSLVKLDANNESRRGAAGHYASAPTVTSAETPEDWACRPDRFARNPKAIRSFESP